MTEELKNEVTNAILGLLPDEEIISVEENCGSVYIDTANGKSYSISIIECEQE